MKPGVELIIIEEVTSPREAVLSSNASSNQHVHELELERLQLLNTKSDLQPNNFEIFKEFLASRQDLLLRQLSQLDKKVVLGPHRFQRAHQLVYQDFLVNDQLNLLNASFLPRLKMSQLLGQRGVCLDLYLSCRVSVEDWVESCFGLVPLYEHLVIGISFVKKCEQVLDVGFSILESE